MPPSAARGKSGVTVSTPGIIRAPMAAAGMHFRKASNLLLIVLLDKMKNGSNRGRYVTAAIPRIIGIILFISFSLDENFL